MTLANAELADRFAQGYDSGKANRMEIVQGPVTFRGETVVPEGHTAVVGYDWAVYAVRSPSGQMTVYDGWREWAEELRKQGGKPGATTTRRHVELLKNRAGDDDTVSNDRPQCDKEPPSVRKIRERPRRGMHL